MTASAPEVPGFPAAPLPPATLRTAVEDDLAAVERSLASCAAVHSTRIGAAARHLLDAPGKRLRPLLSCAVIRALDGDPAPHIDLVAAVELVHAGSLLHDDVIDGAATRRGRPAVHLSFDAHTAILAGDLLLSWAFERLARRGPRALQVAIADAMRDVCEGQVLERERLFDPTVDTAHARLVNRLKTAALFGYAAEAGAILCGAAEPLRAAARAYGAAVGEAFQLVDDLLDWEGRPDAVGKPLGRDLLDGIVTPPTALGLERDPGLRDGLRACWAEPGDGGGPGARLNEVRARLERAGAFAAAHALARADAEAAIRAVAGLPAGPWRDHLAATAREAARRDR